MDNKNNVPVVKVEDLVVHYETRDGVVEAVNGISFEVGKSETLGLVGETGAGKTTTALAILGLLPVPPSRIIRGKIYVDGEDISKKSKTEMQEIRGKKISMIFQDPMTALNPVIRIGDQIAEVILLHEKCSKAEAQQKATEMLEMVGIRGERYRDYPHQLSGGMKQRVVIAIAMICNPEILVADEPTTALDVTIQAQIMELMKQLQTELHKSIILITHNMGLVAEMADEVVVMYMGRIVEKGVIADIFNNPLHPYTKALLASVPVLGMENGRELVTIPGSTPNPDDLTEGCEFADRCSECTEQCRKGFIHAYEVTEGHWARCLKYEGAKEVD